MNGPEVSYERRGALGVVRLERPEALNALTYSMISEVSRWVRLAEVDPAVYAICITGAGRGFCAGLDMSILAQTTAGDQLRPVPSRDGGPQRTALFSFLLDITKPVIAAVNGVAAGGGFILAMMCDLRFVSEDANFITVFGRRGLIGEHGVSWLLPRMIGLSRALDLLWSSRRVSADEAYRLGLADRVTPGGALLETVEAYVADMALTVAPRSVAIMKGQVYRNLALTFDDASFDTEELIAQSLVHPDAAEGAAHFLEKRPPRFSSWTGV